MAPENLRRALAQLAQVRELLAAAHDELATDIPAELSEAYSVSVAANALRTAASHIVVSLDVLAQLVALQQADALPVGN